MTGFIIYSVVLTLAYLLYYAAVITTDMAAQKKAAQTEEEIIDIGTQGDDVDEFATQNVIEDSNTGSFNFFSHTPKSEDVCEIAEAEDLSMTTESQEVEPQQEEPDMEAVLHDSDVQTADDASEIPEETSDDEEDTFGVTTYTFTDDEPKDEPKSFNEEEAFDPSLRQTHFDVKTVYEPTASPEVRNHASTVNASMETISTRGKGLISVDLRAAMRNHENDPHNIEFTDEWTKS